jgi:hypothetical protein
MENNESKHNILAYQGKADKTWDMVLTKVGRWK